MALTESYLVTTKNLQALINSIVSAKAPERFNNKFLEDLEFKSSNDRLYIGVFKALCLLDDSGAPTARYHQFIDPSETAKIITLGIKDAYEDLFSLRKDANNLSIDEVKGKLKTLTQGKKSDKVIGWMANTFKALCDVADWSQPSTKKKIEPKSDIVPIPLVSEINNDTPNCSEMKLKYDIHVHLPETTSMTVYDAIFSSLKKHLL